MAEIHILNAETIDKIAAGEVVERPGSVVKELVENAIDAGATAVTVEAKDGGIEFIRVTDNGCGMERSQLRRAFLRHATSKIQDADDLMQVASLGFRGEALSSIAAVAKVEVITKTKDSITGSRILLEGAREIAFDEVGAPEGTTFLMRNLFYNTPVRRKFLKQPATEGGYIVDLLEHLALSRPDISFKLVLGNQMKFHTSGNGDLKEVIYRIYGRDAANALVPVSAEREGIRVEGYLGKPVQIRSNRNFEIYFINGRFIRSNVVAKAVEEGYKEYLMQHKFPFCVLHIRMEPGCVDVNVHPTKMDVRFSNAMEFSGFLTQTVRDTLRGRDMIPEASLSAERERKAELAAERETSPAAAPEPFEQRRSQAYRVMEEEKYIARNPVRQDFAHNPVWARVKAENSVSTPVSLPESPKAINIPENSAESNGEEEDFFIETTELPEEMEAKCEELNPAPDAVANAIGQNMEKPEKRPESSNDSEIGSAAVADGVQMNFFEEKILTLENRSRFRVVGQVFETYWLVEFEDKLLMIDQHAAHEKVNYERMIKRYREKNILSQGLFPPVIVSLSGQEESVLKEHTETFSALGFEIEEFGGSEYALRSVPLDLYGCNEREMFLEVLDGLLEGNGFGNIRVIEEKIASMSCKAAVKGNRRLSREEAEVLIDELLTLDNPYHCPHGRPTIVAMTKAEMERKFKRIL
nr:DNA mismatch repair endonuclease MutL [uncultured Acetatifactor sp.]